MSESHLGAKGDSEVLDLGWDMLWPSHERIAPIKVDMPTNFRMLHEFFQPEYRIKFRNIQADLVKVYKNLPLDTADQTHLELRHKAMSGLKEHCDAVKRLLPSFPSCTMDADTVEMLSSDFLCGEILERAYPAKSALEVILLCKTRFRKYMDFLQVMNHLNMINEQSLQINFCYLRDQALSDSPLSYDYLLKLRSPRASFNYFSTGLKSGFIRVQALQKRRFEAQRDNVGLSDRLAGELLTWRILKAWEGIHSALYELRVLSMYVSVRAKPYFDPYVGPFEENVSFHIEP